MHESAVRPWTRPHDWAEVVLGLVALLSPMWMDVSTAATWSLVVLGALIAVDGIISLAMPGMVYGEGIQMVLGVLLFISPWVIGYSELTGASWTSWIVGALAFIAGAAAFPIANSVHSRAAGQV